MNNIYESWGMGITPSELEVGTSSPNVSEPEVVVSSGDLYDPLNGRVSTLDDEDLKNLQNLAEELGIDDDYFGEEPPSVIESNLSDITRESLIDTEQTLTQDVPSGSTCGTPLKPETNIRTTPLPDADIESEGILKYLPILKKIVVFGLLPSIAIFAAFIIIGKGGSKVIVPGEQSSKPVSQVKSLDNILLLNTDYSGLSDYVEDILILEKKSIISGDSLVTLFCGNTTKSGVYITAPVGMDLFNSVANGSVLKVRFKQLKINDTVYTTNIEIGGVIE